MVSIPSYCLPNAQLTLLFSAKIRLSKLAITLGRHTEADQILKEINTSHGSDIEFRSYVSHYLHSQEKWVDLSKFATITRRNHPDDLHALCTLGTYHYHLARDSKAPEIERTKDYCRAAEAFAQALSIDPSCTVAAQGLAIAIAEDTLPLRKEGMANKPSDGAAKLRGLDVALSIFTRIKDSMLTSSVLVNMGHCHFAKGDEERAIESVSSVRPVVYGGPKMLTCVSVWSRFGDGQEPGLADTDVSLPSILCLCKQDLELLCHG